MCEEGGNTPCLYSCLKELQTASEYLTVVHTAASALLDSTWADFVSYRRMRMQKKHLATSTQQAKQKLHFGHLNIRELFYTKYFSNWSTTTKIKKQTLSFILSAISKPYRNFNIGDTVTLQLMRREKSELNIDRADSKRITYKIPHLFDTVDNKLHAKLILANREEIKTIIDQERNELDVKFVLEGEDCPESVFIQQALNLLSERQEKLESMNFDGDIAVPAEQRLREPSESDATSSVDLGDHLERMSIQDDESDLSSVHGLQDISLSSPTDLSDASQFFHFYQATDGQHLYLHSINVRMLQATYGCLEYGPTTITGRIVQRECYSMTEELRKRLKYLRHLPITCQFEVVEIQLGDRVLSSDVVEHFKGEFFF